MLKTIQKYVLKDVLLTFLLAVLVFTGVVVLGIIYEFIRAELSLEQMLWLLPYGIPFTLPFTLPIATLLATSLTFGRMSVDNEITAIRTGGVRIDWILSPIIVFGLLVSTASFYLQDKIIPPMHYKLKDTRMLAAKMLMNQKQGENFRRRFGRIQIFASYVRGSEYLGFVATIRTRDQRILKFVARRGKIGIGAEANTLDFTIYDGSLTTYKTKVGENGQGAGDQVPLRVMFPRHTFPIHIPARSRRQSDKTTLDLLKEASFHRVEAGIAAEGSRLPVVRERMALSDLEESLTLAQSPSERTEIETEMATREKNIAELLKPEKYLLKVYRKSVAEAIGRWSLAFGCLIAAVLGSTLPILMRPKNALIPFFAGILFVMIVYFPLHRLGLGLAENGTLSPWIGPWISDLVGGGVGGYLFWKVLKR